MLDSAFLFSYAGAMFISGLVAERVDLRYFLSLGMLVSGIFCYLMGLARTFNIHSMPYFLLVQAGAGVAQTSGWPGTVSVVGNWFGDSKKGLIFGIWNSHTSIGNILGTLLATRYVESDWALSFMYPGLVMGCAGFLVFLLLVPHPADAGLLSATATPTRARRSTCIGAESSSQVIVGDQAASLRPSRHSANIQHTEAEESDENTPLIGTACAAAGAGTGASAVSLSRALRIPGVVEFSLSLFFAKLVSYTFLFWLPLYIKNTTTLSVSLASELSTLFDVGGVVGAVAAGAAADYSGCPAIVCVLFYALSAPALLVYQAYGWLRYSYNMALLLICGSLVNAPYALITTAVSAQLGTHSSLAGNSKALATVTAIIDGTGSVGAAVGPLLAGIVSAHGSWSQVFYMLICCNMCALLLLTRVVRSELSKLRMSRSTRVTVRVE